MKRRFFLFNILALFIIYHFIMGALVPEWNIESRAQIESPADSILWHSSDSTVSMDIGAVSQGIVRIRYSGESPIVKILISKGDEVSYPYWVSTPGEFETFILAFGDGDYEVSVYEWSHEDYYYTIFSETVSVVMEDEMAPFLHPNFFVDYSGDDMIIRQAAAFRLKSGSDDEFITAVFNFVKKYSYDFEKSSRIVSNNALYKTVMDEVFYQRKGICLDYATVMVAMLRSQGIPAKLEFGYVDGAYHSWVKVYVLTSAGGEGEWVLYDPTAADIIRLYAFDSWSDTSENYAPLYVN